MTPTRDLSADRRLCELYEFRSDDCGRLSGVTKHWLDVAERQAAVIKAKQQEDRDVEQVLGKALGFPWFKDDQKNFPGTTEADGVCVGDHVAASIAMEAAAMIERQAGEIERLRSENLKLIADHNAFNDRVLVEISELRKQVEEITGRQR